MMIIVGMKPWSFQFQSHNSLSLLFLSSPICTYLWWWYRQPKKNLSFAQLDIDVHCRLFPFFHLLLIRFVYALIQVHDNRCWHLHVWHCSISCNHYLLPNYPATLHISTERLLSEILRSEDFTSGLAN